MAWPDEERMMSKRRLGAAAAACVLGLAPATGAAISYRYVTDSPTYSAGPGALVPVKVYLQETLTGGSHSLLVGDGGLFNAGAAVGYAALPGSEGNGSPATLSTFAFDTSDFSGLTAQNVAPDGSSLDFQEGVGGSASFGPMGIISAAGRIQFLGTLTVEAGGAGNVSTFSLGQDGGSGNTITFKNAFDLDFNGDGTAADGNTYTWTGTDGAVSNFTVAATPEPSTPGLLAIAASAFLARRRAPSESRR